MKWQVSSNFLIYPGKTDEPSLHPPFETARVLSELYAFQCSQWAPIWNSQIIGRYKEMSVWHQVNLQIYPPPSLPPFKTARALSELYAFQCSQWVPIRNSQLIGRYKEMSVWHQVNLQIYPPPPIQNCQSSEWTLRFSMQSMRAHSKQLTNRKI